MMEQVKAFFRWLLSFVQKLIYKIGEWIMDLIQRFLKWLGY